MGDDALSVFRDRNRTFRSQSHAARSRRPDVVNMGDGEVDRGDRALLVFRDGNCNRVVETRVAETRDGAVLVDARTVDTRTPYEVVDIRTLGAGLIRLQSRNRNKQR